MADQHHEIVTRRTTEETCSEIWRDDYTVYMKTIVEIENNELEEETYPGDRGSFVAMLCTVGAFFALFMGLGSLKIPGIYLPYIQDHYLSEYTHSEIGWIASIQYGLTFLGSVFTGRWFDLYGGRV
jgi:hypothetical protein